MKYFTFPMETLNVTQSYLGNTSHYPHTTGTPKDYPIDCAGIDGGESAIFAPVDMRVTAIRGIGSSLTTNTIWLVTTEKVKTPTFTDYAFMTLTHWNDTDPAITKWKVGSIIKQGEIICYEGKDGAAANHIHMVVGRGESNNWQENSNGKWVITGDTKKPEEVMYIDPNFTTTIKNTGGITWIDVPKNVGTPVSRDETRDQLQVNVSNAYARDSANGNILGYINPGIYNSLEFITKDGYDWHRVEGNIWIANGDWCTWLPKKEIADEDEDPEMIAELQSHLAEKEKEIESLNTQINQLKSTQEQHNLKTFVANKNAKYYIRLNKNEILNYEIK